ncbi:MAG: Fe-S cluster assembly protein SufD [Nitrospinae bacterium]|nr:Fe-S cluster assembly protein SufD [Nitrospinota bacterium]
MGMTLKEITQAWESRLLELYGRFESNPLLRPVNEAAAKRLAELGLPGKKHEMFTFVSLRELFTIQFEFQYGPEKAPDEGQVKKHVYPGCEQSYIVLVDGKFDEKLSNVVSLTGLITVAPLEKGPDIAALMDGVKKENDIFACINSLFLSGGVSVEIRDGTKLETPIQILHLSTGIAGKNTFTSPRVIVNIGSGSGAQVVEKLAGNPGGHFFNAVTEVNMKEGASAQWSRVQSGGAGGFHFSKTRIRMAKDSRFKGVGASSGGKVERHNCEVRLVGEGAELTLRGLAVLEGTEQAHSYFRAYHEAPGCSSYQLFRNILRGASVASVDTAAVVRPGAQLTVSEQLINNLMLSGTARADMKPILMIHADDVKCKHGATVGRVDENQVFYMRSRGLSDAQARALLTSGFAKSVINEIPFAPAAQEADRILLRKLE